MTIEGYRPGLQKRQIDEIRVGSGDIDNDELRLNKKKAIDVAQDPDRP